MSLTQEWIRGGKRKKRQNVILPEKEEKDMLQKKVTLWEEGEYAYPVLGKFVPFLMTYVHEEDEEDRPAVVVVPGGGYCAVAPTEGEVVAKKFYDKGYNTFIVVYSTNLNMDAPLKLQPLKDVSRGFVWVRKHAEELHVNPNAVAICGFSAGGHLSASLCVHCDAPELVETGEYAGISNRPDMAILSYPVITSGEYAHRDSFTALLGADATQEELEYMSLEKQVTKNTPPTFLWTTFTDELVPCENSFLYASACRKAGVQVELHVFGNGIHGRSLADETWAYEGLKAFYTMDQMIEIFQYMVDNDIPLPPPYDQAGQIPKGTDVRQMYAMMMQNPEPVGEPDAGLRIWPDLADAWMAKQRAGSGI